VKAFLGRPRGESVYTLQMVNGRLARACAPSAGLALLLLSACGGKSVAAPGRDPSDGGTSGTGSSSGGASPGTAPNGGSVGVAGGAGRPSQNVLDDLCASICGRASAAACEGIQYGDCLSGCHAYSAVALKTASCSRVVFEYLVCVDALPDICAITEDADAACNSGADAAVDCVGGYCQTHGNEDVCQSY
jgi:hypothetical protein